MRKVTFEFRFLIQTREILTPKRPGVYNRIAVVNVHLDEAVKNCKN